MDQQVFSSFHQILEVKSPVKLLIDTVVSKIKRTPKSMIIYCQKMIKHTLQ